MPNLQAHLSSLEAKTTLLGPPLRQTFIPKGTLLFPSFQIKSTKLIPLTALLIREE